jgi:hypothetical protein
MLTQKFRLSATLNYGKTNCAKTFGYYNNTTPSGFIYRLCAGNLVCPFMAMPFKSENIVLFVSPKRTKKHSEILILFFWLIKIMDVNPKISPFSYAELWKNKLRKDFWLL